MLDIIRFIYKSIQSFFFFYMLCWCVFIFPLTKSTVFWHQRQRRLRQSRSGAWSLSNGRSAPYFPADHVWPSWGDWQDLFTGGETRRKERRKEGEPEGEQPLNGTGIQVFTLDPSFYVCLPRRFFTIEDGIPTLCVFFLRLTIANNETSFVLD